MSFKRLLFLSGLSDTVSAASVFGVSPRTIRRWRATDRPPVSARRLAWVLSGNLPFDGWQGWVIEGGYLFAPGQCRRGFLPSQVETSFLFRALSEDRGQKINQLERLLARLGGDCSFVREKFRVSGGCKFHCGGSLVCMESQVLDFCRQGSEEVNSSCGAFFVPFRTIEAFACDVGVTPECVRGWVSRGQIPSRKIGRRVVVDVWRLVLGGEE